MRGSWRDTARRRPVLWRAGSGGRGDVQAGPTETVPQRRPYYWDKPFLEQVKQYITIYRVTIESIRQFIFSHDALNNIETMKYQRG